MRWLKHFHMTGHPDRINLTRRLRSAARVYLRIILCIFLGSPCAWAQTPALELESKIPLGDIHGRIDHLAVDLARQRLYVAELGNDSVGVVDIKERKTIRTLTGLHEPQGIGYVPSTDTVYVANAKDGSVHLFKGADLTPISQVALGDDADNVRVDDGAHSVFVGYGSGALAIIDANTHAKIGDIALKGHPESFRLEPSGKRIFVNVPDAHEIAVVDRATNKQIASWPTGMRFSNYPLALDEQERVLVVFRHPARLAVFQAKDGQVLNAVPTCGDSDDLFADTRRHRVYVSCGEGLIDVFASQGTQHTRVSHIPTVSGARTSLFV
ncbi:MAG TPA: YncE family protein, partial [Bryobacteraceae bacterium]